MKIIILAISLLSTSVFAGVLTQEQDIMITQCENAGNPIEYCLLTIMTPAERTKHFENKDLFEKTGEETKIEPWCRCFSGTNCPCFDPSKDPRRVDNSESPRTCYPYSCGFNQGYSQPRIQQPGYFQRFPMFYNPYQQRFPRVYGI